MDPTKSFDHLDPKLKETYARVMGTDTSGSNNTAANAATQPDQTASLLTPSPANQVDSPTLDSTQSPTVSSATMNIQQDSSSPQLSQPLETTPPTGNAPDTNAPGMSSFFSNPSPSATEAVPQASVENAAPAPAAEQPVSPTPVTPYTPTDLSASQYSAPLETLAQSQPLPSPSSIGQTAPHETSALLKVLYIIGSVIFFAIYTIFWIKVFNLPFFF